MRDPKVHVNWACIPEKSGAPAAKLCLELTYSVIAMTHSTLIKRRHSGANLTEYLIRRFRDRYSLLGDLKHLPFTELKINRSFVRDVHIDPSADPAVMAIIALARQLKLEIVAEWIEHEAQRRFLVHG